MNTPPIGVRDEDLLRVHEESRLIVGLHVVFVIGPPKTGTTWIMQMLDGHPAAVAHGESAVCRALVPSLVNAFQAYNGHQVKYGADEATRFDDRDFFLFLRQMCDRQFGKYLEASGKLEAGRVAAPSRLLAVIDKSPTNAQHVDLLARLYPRAKFINCTRDVRDGAVSGWFHFGPQGWLEQKTLVEYARVYAVHTWAAMLRAARASGERLGAGRFTEVDYADHHADPAGETRRLLEFIGLPADDASIDACVEAGRFTRRSGGRAAGTEDRASFYRKGVVGDWRNHLSEEEGAEILRLAEEALGMVPVPA